MRPSNRPGRHNIVHRSDSMSECTWQSRPPIRPPNYASYRHKHAIQRKTTTRRRKKTNRCIQNNIYMCEWRESYHTLAIDMRYRHHRTIKQKESISQQQQQQQHGRTVQALHMFKFNDSGPLVVVRLVGVIVVVVLVQPLLSCGSSGMMIVVLVGVVVLL